MSKKACGDGFFVKPFSPAELLEEVKTVLAEGKRLAAGEVQA